MTKNKLVKSTALALATLLASLHLAPLQAALVDNGRILQQAGAQLDRERLVELVQRDEVRDRLAALGVEADQLDQRIARLTDQEVAELNERLGELPAGGVDALGVALVVFIVFVITDVIGATDVFPFIKPVKQ